MPEARGGEKLNIPKVLLVGKLALAAVLAAVVVQTVVVLRGAAGSRMPASAAGAERTTAVQPGGRAGVSAEEGSVIIEQNIFSGTRSSPQAGGRVRGPSAADAATSAEGEMGLVLMGTISGSPVAARAILRDVKSNIQEEYRLGDMVAGARVQSIEKDAVVLLHNGQSKVLRLQVGRNHPQSNIKTSESQAGNAVAKTVKSDSPPMQPVPETAGQVDTILSSAIIEPHLVNGQTEGLRISGVERIPLVRDIGLRDGDIIRQVNGHQLTDKRKAYQVLQKARTQPTVSVELQRAGRTKELSFALP